MKFYIKKVILWLNNGKKREIKFEPNKVNIITGDSSTGKTEILDIIDYCFFSSESKISESIVNENISWYGILFNINGKNYTIARKSLTEGKVTDKYYFSSDGEIPDKVSSNNTEGGIKSLLETEFSIDSNVTVSYGSNLIKSGTKISLRYFFMFNTISVNIIENVLKKEKKLELEKKLSRLNRKNRSITDKASNFQQEQESIIREAKEFSLIDSNLDLKSSLAELKKLISGVKSDSDDKSKNEQVESDIYLVERKIVNLRRFSIEYTSYKKNLAIISDSLKPVSFLIEKDADIIKTSIFDDVMNSFSSELNEIKTAHKTKTPIDKQIADEIKSLENGLSFLKKQLAIHPKVYKNFENDNKKYFFLGEIKSKMDLYSSSGSSIASTTVSEILDLENKLDLLTKSMVDTLEKREHTIKLIEEIISEYIEASGTALVNYAGYKPVFNYADKALLLRKPKTSFIENVGSSSNHMFLHLFFTLAMQEIAFQNKSPFVAPYLIIDQPSRPYYGDETNKKILTHSDESKITKAFELLDKFIGTRISNSGDFQMIIFEHVPRKIFADLKNVHLVEEFYNGNALIPADMLNEE